MTMNILNCLSSSEDKKKHLIAKRISLKSKHTSKL